MGTSVKPCQLRYLFDRWGTSPTAGAPDPEWRETIAFLASLPETRGLAVKLWQATYRDARRFVDAPTALAQLGPCPAILTPTGKDRTVCPKQSR
jgi:hypothetical protein